MASVPPVADGSGRLRPMEDEGRAVRRPSASASPQSVPIFLAAGPPQPVPPQGPTPPIAKPPVQKPLDLSPEVEAHLKANNRPEKQKEIFLRLCRTVYGYVPQTPQELDTMINGEALWILAQTETQRTFIWMHKEFGYRFAPNFVEGINGTVDVADLRRSIMLGDAMSGLGRSLSGQSASEADRGRRRSARVREVFAKRIEKYRATFTPAVTAGLQRLQRHYAAQISFEGLMLMRTLIDRKGHDVVVSALRDFKTPIPEHALKTALGPLYSGNELMTIIATAFSPTFHMDVGTWQRLFQIPHAPLRVWDVVAIVEATSEGGFESFLGWALNEMKIPISWDTIENFLVAYRALKKKGPIAALDARHATAFAARNSLPVTPDTLDGLFWSKAEEAVYDKLHEEFGLTLSVKNLMAVQRMSSAIQENGLDTILDNPAAPRVMAALREKDDGVVSWRPLLEGLAILSYYEKQQPGAIKLLAQLADYGVAYDRIDLRLFAKKTIPLLTQLKTDSALWNDVKQLLKAKLFDVGAIELDDLRDFVQLPEERRRLLALPAFSRVVNALHKNFALPKSYAEVSRLVQSLHEPNAFPIWEQYALVSDSGFLKFWKTHRALFFQPDGSPPMGRFHSALFAAQLFHHVDMKLPKKGMLQAAQRYHRVTKDSIDVMFINFFHDGYYDKVLNHPQFDALPQVLAGIDVELKLGLIASSLEKLLSIVPVLKQAQFKKFVGQMRDRYGFGKNAFEVDDLVALYRNAKDRRYLHRPETRAAFLALQRYGFKRDGNWVETLRTYQRQGIVGKIAALEKAYDLDIPEVLGRVAQARMMQILNPLQRGKQYSFLAEFSKMAANGVVKTLMRSETIAFHGKFRTAYQFILLPLEFQAFAALAKNERLRERLLHPDCTGFFTQLHDRAKVAGSPFSIVVSQASIFADLSRHRDAVIRVLDGIEKHYRYTFSQDMDLGDLLQLAQTPAVRESLLSEESQRVVKHLGERHGYSFNLDDAWAIVHLATHPNLTREIYGARIDAIATKVFGKQLGNALVSRLVMHRFVTADPKGAQLLLTDGFKRMLALLKKNGLSNAIQGLSPQDLPALATLMRTPEILTFLEDIDALGHRGFDMFGTSRPSFYVGVSGLATIAKNAEAPRYVEALKRLVHYEFDFRDGRGLEALMRTVPEGALKSALARFTQETQNKRPRLGDILYYLHRGNAFRVDDKQMHTEVKAGFTDDVHRTDSNFDSYTSYNTPEKLSRLSLNKVVELRAWLMRKEVRQGIGKHIVRDVEKHTNTELGALVLMDGQRLKYQPFDPWHTFANGAYHGPQEAVDLHSMALAATHNHATRYDSGHYAAPSGSLLSAGGDIGWHRKYRMDGLVFTSLKKGEFAVHFYDPDGNVIFVGKYLYPHALSSP